jgi:hypothetical protein
MKTISREIIPKNFRYKTTLYNKRHGCSEEKDANYTFLSTRIDQAKYKFYKSYKLKPEDTVCLNTCNVGIDYIAMVLAIAELGLVLTNDYNNCKLHIHNNLIYEDLPNSVFHEEFAKINIKNIDLYNTISSRRAKPDKLFYKHYTHADAVKHIKSYAKQYNGKILHIGYANHLNALLKYFLPSLASGNVFMHYGLGYDDIREFGGKFNFVFDSEQIETANCDRGSAAQLHKILQRSTFPARDYKLIEF